MIVLKSLLSELSQPEVTELVLQSGKRPSIRVHGADESIGGPPVSNDDLVQVLFSAGGSRYVESLGAKPTQWRTRVEGVGAVTVTATQRGDVIEARFMLRDAAPGATAAPAQGAQLKPRAPTVPPVKAPKTGRPPRGDAPPSSRSGPPSRRKQGGRGHDAGSDTPRAPSIAMPPPTPRREEPKADTPPPPPMRRGELPTLPSDTEIDLDIHATDIPSVPNPMFSLDEASFGPISPRTLPEARFSRETTPPVVSRETTPPVGIPRAIGIPVDTSPRQTSPRAPSITVETSPRQTSPRIAGFDVSPRQTSPRVAAFDASPRQTSPRLPGQPAPLLDAPSIAASEAHGEVAELTEPFAMSMRRPEVTPMPGPPGPSQRTQSGRTTRPFARDPHTPAFRKLLRAAREAGASDLHLVAGRPPLLRVAGQVLPKGDPIEPGVIEDMMLSRVPSRLAAVLDRDGSCDFALEEPELGRFRVNVSRQRTGIKASMRLIAAEVASLADLGLPDAIAGATRHHQGLIVITGPTGHGKTTTLASIVDILNRETTRHIITVEDPIEYLHPRKMAMMSQREIGTHTRSFQSALKASLREDPDVIVVGELRDTETVRMAISASETGHLVIGTMNTPSAAKTIDRIIDLFPPADQQQVRMTLAGGLRLVVSQKLLPDVEGKRMVAAAEVLPGMVPLWNLIRDGRTYQIPSLQQRGKGYGVIRLDDSLLELVRAGRTTAAAAIAVAEAPEEMENVLGVRRGAGAPVTSGAPRGTSPVRPPEAPGSSPTNPRATDPRGGDAGKGGFFERAGALFGGGGGKKGT